MRLRFGIQQWWHVGYGLLWSIQFGLYSTNRFFGITGFHRLPNDAFNLASITTVIICCAAVALLYWRRVSLPRFLPVGMPTGIYLAAILLVALLPTGMPQTPILISAGIVSGACYALLLLNWFKLFALEKPRVSARHIAVSSLIGAALCYLIAFVPFAVAMTLAVSSLLLSGYAQAKAIRNEVTPLASDDLRTPATALKVAPTVTSPANSAPQDEQSDLHGQPETPKLRGNVASRLADPAAFCAVLGFAFAITSQVSFVGPAGFVGSNNIFNLGMLVAALFFLTITFAGSKSPNPATIYRVLFPALGAALLLLPFLNEHYWVYLVMFVIIASHLVSIAFVFLVADVVHTTRVESNIVSALAHALVQLAILLGVLLGIYVIDGDVNAIRLMIITGATVYLLMMALLLLVRHSQNRAISDTTPQEVAVNAKPPVPLKTEEIVAKDEAQTETEAKNTTEAAPPTEKRVKDRARDAVPRVAGPTEEIRPDSRISYLADRHALTRREQEILSYLCRGRSTPYICDALALSQNTVHSHIKHLYVKLDIHNRQELLDLLEQLLKDSL
jgi:DNA-binding CsgD family transcriptional regulator